MALKAVVDDIEGVEEAHRDLYTEGEDGKYVLQVEGVDHHPEVAGLVQSYGKEQKSRQKYKAELDKLKSTLPEDFDPEQWEALKQKAEHTGDDAKVKQVQQEYERKLEEARNEAAQLKEQLRNTSVERDLTAALEKSGVTNPALKSGAMAMLRGSVKLDDDGNPVMDTKMGPKPIADAVNQWASSDDGKHYVTVDNNSGGGAQGANGRGQADTGKQVTREQWDQMDHGERAEFSRGGGRVVNE